MLQIPAKVRFVSVEPMLSEIDISSWLYPKGFIGMDVEDLDNSDNKSKLENDLHWVICGGESGHNARPMHPDWVRSLKDQCENANVPFFFKQWGEWVSEFHEAAKPGNNNINDCFVDITKDGNDYTGQYMVKVGKKKAGCSLDNKEYKQFPNA